MNPEKQPGQSNPYEVLVPIEKIKKAQTFDELYRAIEDIRATDAEFCSDKMMQNIYDIEGAKEPNFANVPAIFTTITRKYGLREKVIELVRMMPPKIVQANEKSVEPQEDGFSDDPIGDSSVEGFTPKG